MQGSTRTALMATILFTISLTLIWANSPIHAQEGEIPLLIAGSVFDRQNQPVRNATVTLHSDMPGYTSLSTETQPSGVYGLEVMGSIPDELTLHIERANFGSLEVPLTAEQIQELRSGEVVILPDMVIVRRVTAAFWLSALIFVGVLVLIATEKLHNNLAALLGASLVYLISYLGNPIHENLFIFNFQQSLTYIDWKLIFLIMGMMIVIRWWKTQASSSGWLLRHTVSRAVK